MAPTQTLERPPTGATLAPAPADANAEIAKVQHKMDDTMQAYVRDFCKRYPTFSKDSKINRDHVLLEAQRFWPGWGAQAEKFWQQVNTVIHRLPPAGTSSAVVVRIFVVSPKLAPASLPQPHESVAIATFDGQDGLMLSYVVPASPSLPSFDGMMIPSGLMVLCQPVPPQFNEFTDNRATGMGAGADIYGPRARDRVQKGDDPVEQTPPLFTPGMPWGMGGPPVLGVPPMGQNMHPAPMRQEEENQESAGGEIIEGAAAAAAAAELGHIVAENARRRRETEAETTREENRVRNEEQARREREAEAEGAAIAAEQAEPAQEPRAETEAIGGPEAEAGRQAADEGAAVASEKAEIAELAAEEAIAEVEITSPQGAEGITLAEQPQRPEMPGEVSETSETQVEPESAAEAAEIAEPETAEAANEAPEPETGIEPEALEAAAEAGEAGNEAASAEPETAEGGSEALEQEAAGEPETVESQLAEAQQEVTAGEPPAEAEAEAEAVPEAGDAPEADPRAISGASGSVEVDLAGAGEGQDSDQSQQEEMSPEEMKDKLDQLREQMGDEEEAFSPEKMSGEEGGAEAEGAKVEAADAEAGAAAEPARAHVARAEPSELHPAADNVQEIQERGEATADLRDDPRAEERRPKPGESRAEPAAARNETVTRNEVVATGETFAPPDHQQNAASPTPMAEHFMHAHDLHEALAHDHPHFSPHAYAAAPPIPTHTSPHALNAVTEGVVAGVAVKQKRIRQNKRVVAATEARIRDRRSHEWQAQRTRIKAAAAATIKKRKTAKIAAPKPENFPTLTLDE